MSLCNSFVPISAPCCRGGVTSSSSSVLTSTDAVVFVKKNGKSASSCFVSLHMEFLTSFLTFVTLFNILSLNIPMGNSTLPHSHLCLGSRHIFGCWSSVSTACHDFTHFSLFQVISLVKRPPSERMEARLMLRYVEAWNRLRCAANFCFHAESIE